MSQPTEPEYTLLPARYAKGMIELSCPSNGMGYKTRAMYLACALNTRWVNRSKAYILSPTKAAKFKKLFAEGWDATCFGELIPPKDLWNSIGAKNNS